MKIGIITFHHVENYGATLQAYALWNFLNNQGYDVEIIDYRPYKAVSYYSKGLSPISKKLRINQKFFYKIVRGWKFRRFLLSHVKLSPKKFYSQKSLQKFHNRYDVAICGSDQIWCLTSFRGFDSSFFLDFVNNETTCKISYAASFGDSIELKCYQTEISKLISQFQTVLVRDNNSLDIIQNECHKEAIKVLDPTFLIHYDAIKCLPKIENKYLLIYNQAEFELIEEQFIQAIAKAQNLIIVSVGKYNRLAQINLESASPQEWIGLFNQASYTVTNTYHGTIFSIIFKKPFSVFVKANKSNKIVDLLEDLGLESRIFNPKIVDEQILHVDYDSVFRVLESKIIESKQYLVNAITQRTVVNRSKAEHTIK